MTDFKLQQRKRTVSYEVDEVNINGGWYELSDAFEAVESLASECTIPIDDRLLGDALVAINVACKTVSGYYYVGPAHDDFWKQLIDSYMSDFKCLDCKVDTSHRTGIGEYYMVHNSIWESLNIGKRGMMCIGCLEARIGRKLNSTDFTDCPLNKENITNPTSSKRLIDRLNKSNE